MNSEQWVLENFRFFLLILKGMHKQKIDKKVVWKEIFFSSMVESDNLI